MYLFILKQLKFHSTTYTDYNWIFTYNNGNHSSIIVIRFHFNFQIINHRLNHTIIIFAEEQEKTNALEIPSTMIPTITDNVHKLEVRWRWFQGSSASLSTIKVGSSDWYGDEFLTNWHRYFSCYFFLIGILVSRAYQTHWTHEELMRIKWLKSYAVKLFNTLHLGVPCKFMSTL